jgi:hypothetical protein
MEHILSRTPRLVQTPVPQKVNITRQTRVLLEFRRDPIRFLQEDPLLRPVFREALRDARTLEEVRYGVLFPVCDTLINKAGVDMIVFNIAQITTTNGKAVDYRLRNDLRQLAWTKATLQFIRGKHPGKRPFVFSSATLLGIKLPEEKSPSRESMIRTFRLHGLSDSEIHAVFKYQPENRIGDGLTAKFTDEFKRKHPNESKEQIKARVKARIQEEFKEHCDDMILNAPVTDIVPTGKVHRSSGCKFELEKAEEVGKTREIVVHKDAKDYPLFVRIAEEIRCFKEEQAKPVTFQEELAMILRGAASAYRPN